MITLSILVIAVIIFAIVAALFALIGGGAFIVAFGDLIIFGLIVWLIVRLFRRKR